MHPRFHPVVTDPSLPRRRRGGRSLRPFALALGLAGLLGGCASPDPDRCTALVAVEELAIERARLDTSFSIELGAERPAWVYVEYSIAYRDASGARRTEPGVLRERLGPGAHERTSRDVVPLPPAETLSVRIHEITCTPVQEPSEP